jgi:hypothetical protein
MSDGQRENRQEVEPSSVSLAVARKWADGIMFKQPDPDRKKGKSDGNHQSSRFVWTDEVSVVVQCVYWQEY